MKQTYFKLIFSLFLFCSSFIFSQETSVLPKKLTQEEKGILSNYQFRSAQLTPPPSGSVRAAAEWEEVEYLVLAWQPSFQNILRQIVAAAVNECKVLIATQNQASVSSYLTSNGVSLTNVIFLNAPSNSIWIRDYAGNTIYSDDVGQRALTDWIYNRPRPLDNAMPSAHATHVGIPIYITNTGTNDLVNTGGNYMSDGLGNAFASELILEENAVGNPYNVSAKTEEQIDNIMLNYMGIDNYIKMPTLPYDEIHHIDMHMKLLDEETLLVSRYPNGVADGPQIQANINYVLNNFTSHFGTPYDVYWIDAPPSTSGSYPDTGGLYRTYSNSVIINKTILVPTYRPEVDAAALALYQQLMPGYTVVGIDVDNAGENLISSLGAIHCITHTIGVADPLLIVHQPIDEANAGTNVSVNAMIKHSSGIFEATVFWREQGTTDFNETLMSFVSNDNWTATIPIPSSGNDIEYYINGHANSGKKLNRPIVAPEGFWTINVQTLSSEEWALNHISEPYPNPTKETVNFNLDQIEGAISVTITNTIGQLLFSQKITSANGILSLNLQPEWNGTLFVQFEGDFGKVTKKVVKL
ncbi:agmatine deiminase family protein [Flavobacterium sp.]|uniref:agmatine deiminase family protein n=1 Tax=Flavobacterium sp. TaxID=239 RepID=UPI002B4B51BF|nr:agmatine deiminase family protein [Flavobacterium sp.]HLP63345.1 agmatine deiminase family protein [Flavobacterium sp.]